MKFRRKFTEKRMIFIQENTSCVRRAHLEPGSIPEYRSKVLFNFFSVLYFARCLIKTFPPSFSTEMAFSSSVSVVYTLPCVSSTCAGYTQKSQSLTASLPSIHTSRFSFCGVSISFRFISTLPSAQRFPIGIVCVPTVPLAYTFPNLSLMV